MAKRYDQMLALVAKYKPRRIVEVGVHRGLRAQALCREALIHRDSVSYVGYDVFDTVGPKFQEEALNGKGAPSKEQAATRLKSLPGLDFDFMVGDTRETLHGSSPAVDFAFIDGDHRVEAIRGDYEALKHARVVVLDDFFVADENGYIPNLDLYGANRIVESITDAEVRILPVGDRCKHGGYSRLALIVRSCSPHGESA